MKACNLHFKITEESTSKAIGLPSTGEPFFKGGQLDVSNYTKFLKSTYQTISWSKRVLQNCVEEKWHPLITILERFVTCEGRYAIFFLYHIQLLSHFIEDSQMNVPHFLRLSLHKMARGVQSEGNNPETAIYHHSLIKMIIVVELSKRRKSWKTSSLKNSLVKEHSSKANRGSST